MDDCREYARSHKGCASEMKHGYVLDPRKRFRFECSIQDSEGRGVASYSVNLGGTISMLLWELIEHLMLTLDSLFNGEGRETELYKHTGCLCQLHPWVVIDPSCPYHRMRDNQ